MLNRLYETPGELQEATRALAQQLAEGPFIAIKHTKANLRKGMESTLEETLNLEAENQGKNFLTKDFLEGVQAFFEKRKPKYQGK
jgi:2-(1,2-epoxy-1,2-dihydrophenyl)acetyl-CoA isomerase